MNKYMKLLWCLLVAHCISSQAIDAPVMKKTSKIFVAGHRGLVGSALMRTLQEQGYTNLVVRSSKEVDLRDTQAVDAFFAEQHPEFVFLAAAKVGGILANYEYPVDFLHDNLLIQVNVLQAAHKYNVTKLILLGSSCIYPRECPQPIKEEYLLTGPLEITNSWYAIAKIAGLKLCQAYNRQYGTRFISCMPTNLYGPGDNFDLKGSHVLPALIAKICQAQRDENDSVIMWGTGMARREFLHTDDLAHALIFLMQHYEGDSPINVGTGKDITINELAHTIAQLIGYTGTFIHDLDKPNGTPKKLLNIDILTQLGWSPKINLKEGLRQTISWYQKTL